MDLILTPAAARFMRMMILADGDPDSGFRMAVSPGGCAGLTADVAVATQPAAEERAVVVDGIRLYLNAQSRMLLQGVTVDFVDSLSSQGLVFNDPKQVASCATSLSV